MDHQENSDAQDQLEEWERIYREESDLTLNERKTKQLQKLHQIVGSLHDIFGDAVLAATKKVRGEALNESENAALQQNPDQMELIDRVKGLIKGFKQEFYNALESTTGVALEVKEIPKDNEKTSTEPPLTEAEAERRRAARLPKGFNRWDLKQIKLHESVPAQGNRVWVEYWTLKGQTAVGEILYNPTKDLYYFKPHDNSISSFALTDEHGRKATTQARNYYFRVSPNPPADQ